MTDLIDPEVLFGEDHGVCCDCCAGYCPQVDIPEGGDYPSPMVAFTLDDVEYVASHHVALRRDVLAPLPDAVVRRLVKREGPPPESWAPGANAATEEFIGPMSAALMDSFDAAGLEVREFGDEKMLLLYRGGRHVGWTTKADPKGRTVIVDSELPVVRRIAGATGLPMNLAAEAHRIAHGGEI